MQEKISDKYLDDCFDENNDPNELATNWEKLIDIFYDKFGI